MDPFQLFWLKKVLPWVRTLGILGFSEVTKYCLICEVAFGRLLLAQLSLYKVRVLEFFAGSCWKKGFYEGWRFCGIGFLDCRNCR